MQIHSALSHHNPNLYLLTSGLTHAECHKLYLLTAQAIFLLE